MWLRSVSGRRLFFLLVVGYLGESPFLDLAARAGELLVIYYCSHGLLFLGNFCLVWEGRRCSVFFWGSWDCRVETVKASGR
jgi:hypothetical protein